MLDLTQYKFDLQRSPNDPRDYMLESVYPDDVKLPEIWDLRNNMLSIRDQGNQGTCSAQTVAAIKEWEELVDVEFKQHMSPQFIYNLRANTQIPGMYPRNTMEILFKIGIVPEINYPYGSNDHITDELYKIAEKYKIQGYAQVNTIDSLKKALFANGPCFIAFPVYDPQNMHFWKPNFVGQQAIGGHAVTIVGYRKNDFIIRNSWSAEWGELGHTYYPFDQFGMHWEIWTAIDADSNPEKLVKMLAIYKRKNRKKRIKK
jgi:C1A family cysteine protease